VIDDASTDGTREIAAADTGVTLVDYPGPSGLDDARFSQVYLDLYRQHSRGVADWVIISDCDELVYADDLRALLGRTRHEGAQILGARGYQMLTAQPPETDGQLWEVANEGVYDWRYNKTVALDPALDVLLTHGRHIVDRCDPPTPQVNPRDLMLLHYRWLGDAYIVARQTRNKERMGRGQDVKASVRRQLEHYHRLFPLRERLLW
jgi:hypothetical protein